MEQTLVLVKGDGVRRRLVGEIIRRIEVKGLDIRSMQLMDVSRELAEEHYAEHREKPFFEELVEFITATPVVVMRVEGESAIQVTRRLMGATNPAEAAPGTIRGDLALSLPNNLVHGSDSPELLRMVGYDFEAQKSGFPEVFLDDPTKTVEVNARGKALAVALKIPGEVVLAADTVVHLPEERETLGQSGSEDDVRRMLGVLEGRAHEVYSGVAVARGEDVIVQSTMTRVNFRELTEAEISAYVELGEGVGKAGGYAIQGKAALFVEGIEGDYTNVVGLPLALTSRILEEFGVRWY